MNNIEVEVRGPLDNKEFIKIKNFMDKNALFIKEKDRLSMIYFKDKIPKNSFGIKNEKVDLRIRITNKKSELVMKYGGWAASDSREEYIIPFDIENLEEIIYFLKCLDWSIVVTFPTKTYQYKYKNIELSLVKVQNYNHYYYEAEILVDNKKQVKDAKSKILKIIKELGLKDYKKDWYENMVDDLNNKKDFQFDFKKVNPNLIKSRFKEFF